MLIFNLLTLSLLSYVSLSFSQSFSTKNIDFKVEQFQRHNTVKFYSDYNGISNVILRRGNDVQFAVELNNPFNGEQIQVLLTFATRRDKLVIDLPTGNGANGWTMNQSGNGDRIDASIHIPGNAPVGVWKIKILLKNGSGQLIEEIETPHKIIVLFNPWSTEDAAYFPEQHKLREYLMNERGFTYSFNYVSYQSHPWIFGQFQPEVLDAIMFVLDRANLKANERGDIALVSRELTYLLNDDGRRNRGVLQGRWEEPYGPIDGRPSTKPWEWTGSPPIFKQYIENGGKPVGYGQCWVFAGILTTAYRSLGIASRPVSNFLSAHSRKRDLTIDIFLDKKGEIARRELVWNFHVWVQAWFNRNKDLGNEYFGWQELDATPQERNDGRFKVGPASNIAIRNSLLSHKFETDFLYEEVNADEVIWSADKTIMSINRDTVGLAVMTKQYGGSRPEDITRLYKPAENTPEERESYRKAAKSLEINPPSLNSSALISARSAKQEIIIDIQTAKQILIGSPVSVKVNVKNPSSSSKQFEVGIKATAIYYNGKDAGVLKVKSHQIKLGGLKSQTIQFNITPEEYIGKLRDQYTILIESVARRDRAVAFQKKLFSLKAPELAINGPKSVNVNQTFTMNVQIKNPFNRRLSGCYIAVEGTRIGRKVIKVNDIAASSVGTATVQLQSLYANRETVVIRFFAGNLLQMLTSAEFNVNGRQSYQFARYVIKGTKNRSVETRGGSSNIVPRSGTRVRRITPDQFECCSIVKIR